jgi:GAF domain-containing protein
VARSQAGRFPERQIELLKTFADQAVIAIENTRLFEEVQARTRDATEALEYQMAASDVLAVISRSPTDVQPVFDAIVGTARRLCAAEHAILFKLEDGKYHVAANSGSEAEFIQFLKKNPIIPAHGTLVGRTALEKRTVYITDALSDPTYRWVEAARRGKFRSDLGVPLLREGEVIGVIVLVHSRSNAFTDKQVHLVETFADQAVIAIENTRLFEAEQASKRELTEALEQQTATADVLKVISRSALDVQKVLDALVESAARLCEAYDAAILQVEGDDILRVVAHHGSIPRVDTLPLTRGNSPGRAVLDRQTIHVADIQAEADEFPDGSVRARHLGFRTILNVPLMHGDDASGVISIRRAEVRPFTERQIDLVNTFADQAVIAIENTRLFEEVQARTRDATEALEYQTATSDVLEAISRSPTDAQPVFNMIAKSAARLCAAQFCHVFRFDGELIHFVASHGHSAEALEATPTQGNYPMHPGRGTAAGRAIASGSIEEISDVHADPEYLHGDIATILNISGILAVPMLKDNRPIGAIIMARSQAGRFPARQIELLKTFADQAVIAIENTRLFEAEQASKRELQASLEYQTATSEVLNVISRSPSQLQPVVDAIVQTAKRLCSAERATMWRWREGKFDLLAHTIIDPALANYLKDNPIPPDRTSLATRAVLNGHTMHVPDLQAEPELGGKGQVVVGRIRTLLAVPLLRKGEPIGVLSLSRSEVKPFSDSEIELVQTFADQAVIAIENTRLFEAEQASKRGLTEALEQQTAIADVLKVISRSALDVQKVLDALVESAARLCNAYDALILQVFGDDLRVVAHHGQIPTAAQLYPIARGLIGARAVIDRRTIQVADMQAEADEYPESRKNSLQLGYRTSLSVPLVHAGKAIGAILIRRAEVRPFTERQVELVNTFADQAVIAIENTRLFEEVQTRTRELAKTVEDLEIASQHKNQFVANMSHELRTPLAAILGYAELIQEGFYEPQGPKSLDALTRIRSNGKHLLGLINTVLDIAKIESGQFTLNMTEYAIESVVETVRAATESLAQNKKLALTTSVDKALPIGLGDEQRLTQVLLNLVGNAIKFTDAGEVSIAAGARNGHFAVSVTDTGPGIPLDQQDRIFDQFHQVDSSFTKAKGGTGLGLAIAKQIVEMHGGRIWVVSTPGKGSTFQMELPTRAEFRKPIQGSLG